MRVAGASPLIAIGAHSAEAYLQCVAPCGMAGTTVACHRSPLASTLQRNSAIPRSRRAPSAMAAPASASPVTTRQLPALEQSAEAVAALAAANPAYAAALATQQAIVELAVQELQLQAAEPKAAGPGGAFVATSQDGSSAAVTRAYQSTPVHWLNSSALCNHAAGFGSCRLLGFAAVDRDTPHFALEQTLTRDRMLGVITLCPRQHWITDSDYLNKYFSTAPREGLLSYNEITNRVIASSERLPGWRYYTSPHADVKVVIGTSISFSFPAQQDNLDEFRAAALDVARLWVAFLQEPPAPARSAADCHSLDARYCSAITSDPGNAIAVRLFGEEATNLLLKMATGHPAVAAQ